MNDANMGERIKAARRSLNMSAAELAKVLGVREDTIGKWKSGQKSPRANRMSMLASVLNVSVGWLLNGSQSGDGVEVFSDAAELPTDRAEMLHALREIKNLQARAIARIAKLEQALLDGA